MPSKKPGEGTSEAPAGAIARDRAATARRVAMGILTDAAALSQLADLLTNKPAEFERALLEFEQSGMSARLVTKIKGAVKDQRRAERLQLRVVSRGEVITPNPLRVLLPDAPCPPGVLFPLNYSISTERGVEHQRNTADGPTVDPVTSVAVFISARLVDVSTKREAWRLAWEQRGRWRERDVDRAVLADTRAVVALANDGFPVTSLSAKGVVKYLDDFQAANRRTLPVLEVTDGMGWIGGKTDRFMFGRKLITAAGDAVAEVNVADVAPEDWREDYAAFRGSDEGTEQMADAYTTAGTFEKWREAVELAAQFPRVLLMLQASLAGPLLEILGVLSFIVDLSSPTSQGKTSALRLAGSAHGRPDESAGGSVVGNWNSTRVHIERSAAALNGLPLLLDDTKLARDPRVVAQTIYDLCGGQGRGRGSIGGIRRRDAWRLVMLSTGEQKITAFTTGDGGTHARALCLWGAPFGATSPETAKTVRAINGLVLENYGHAGPAFVRYLLENRAQWPAWRAEHARTRNAYAEKMPESPVADRLATFAAAVALAGRLASGALGIPNSIPGRPRVSPMDLLWPTIAAAGSEGADRALAALGTVAGWAEANEKSFYGRHDSTTDRYTGEEKAKQPPAGWLGKWGPRADWSEIAFYPHKLRAFLADEGFEPDAIISTWRDRGWLVVDKDGQRLERKARCIDDEGRVRPTRLVTIKRAAFDGEDIAPDDPPDGTGGGGFSPNEWEQPASSGNTVGTAPAGEVDYIEELNKSVPTVPTVPTGFSRDEEEKNAHTGGDSSARFFSHDESETGGNSGNSGNNERNQQVTDMSGGNKVGTNTALFPPGGAPRVDDEPRGVRPGGSPGRRRTRV